MNMTKPSTPIFKQISSFQILSFHVFPLIYLNILISATLNQRKILNKLKNDEHNNFNLK